MILQVDWNEPIIKADDVLKIQPNDLHDFYCSASDFDKSNIFFVMLASYHHYMDIDNRNNAAHLCYLMANYLFITLTPPASCVLAKHYIEEAVSLNPLDEYKEWVALIGQGN